MDLNNMDKVNPRLPKFHLSVQPEIYTYWKLHTGAGLVNHARLFRNTGLIIAATLVLFQASHMVKNRYRAVPASTFDPEWAKASAQFKLDNNMTSISVHQKGKPAHYKEPVIEERDGN
ncbi:hypothetical protein PROFUN_05773 [Planoprotostelium fungivorum]|uniref:Uncharacterized protein n=1 Tax=Planoprotostelium fungivorum TaxID=1890364 RepID=A0A2P6NPX4_9EUKA|nr:hypothetical protein PROFUN_05773 [Planoprotostelium fungivorum]